MLPTNTFVYVEPLSARPSWPVLYSRWVSCIQQARVTHPSQNTIILFIVREELLEELDDVNVIEGSPRNAEPYHHNWVFVSMDETTPGHSLDRERTVNSGTESPSVYYDININVH